MHILRLTDPDVYKGNECFRRKYYRLTLKNGKPANVVKTAVTRELACFIRSMMTGNYA